MCYQAVVRIQIWVTEMFLKSMCIRLMEIYDKSASMVTSAVFNKRKHVDFTMVVWNRTFRAF